MIAFVQMGFGCLYQMLNRCRSGNRIGRTERELKEVADELFEKLERMRSASLNKNKDQTRRYYQESFDKMENYLSISKLREIQASLQ